MINKFRDENRFLSNFTPVNIIFDGVIYPSTEHAYVAAKTLNRQVRDDVRRCKTAGEAKRVGRSISLRPDWNEVRTELMENFLRQKFDVQYFQELLMQTGTQTIVEGNTWHDNFWGSCVCQNKTCNNTGSNNLGKLLMKIRGELQQGNLFS